MSRYDGLIIPRSYSEYINKTDAATLLQALQLSGVMDNAPTYGSNHPAKSGGIYSAINGFIPKIQGLHATTLTNANLAYEANRIDYTTFYFVNGTNVPREGTSFFIQTEHRKYSNSLYFIVQTAHASNTYNETYTRLAQSTDNTNWTWGAWEKTGKTIIEETTIPSQSWAVGVTSIKITSNISQYVHNGYTRVLVGESTDQNYLLVNFSVLPTDVYMNVYNGYSGALNSAIKIQMIFIKP